MFFYDMRPSFICEPNWNTVFRVYRLRHTHSLTKDFPSLALERFTKSVAERWASAALASRSEARAEAGKRRLQADVRPESSFASGQMLQNHLLGKGQYALYRGSVNLVPLRMQRPIAKAEIGLRYPNLGPLQHPHVF